MFSFGQCFNPGHQVEDLSSRLLRLPLKKESCMLKIHLDQTWPSKQISCKKKRRILMNSWLVRLICPQLSCQEIVSQDAVLNCQFVAPVLPNLQQFVKSWIPTASIAGIACFAVQLFKVLLTNPKKLISVVRIRICRLDISWPAQLNVKYLRNRGEVSKDVCFLNIYMGLSENRVYSQS